MTAASKDRSGKQQKVENIRPTNPGNRIRNEELTLAGIHRRFHATNPRSRQRHPRKADVPESTSSRTDFKSYLFKAYLPRNRSESRPTTLQEYAAWSEDEPGPRQIETCTKLSATIPSNKKPP